ncbi:MAG: TrmH family RNA methyltransferase [Bdellovibrionales bacterium]
MKSKSPQPIASAQNAKYKTWLSLTTTKGIRAEAQALVSGAKLTAEFARLWPDKISAVLMTLKMPPPNWLSSCKGAENTFELSHELFQSLDVLGTHHPLLVVEAPPLKKWDVHLDPQGLELVVALGDPNNLGALLRSAEAMGAARVILTEEAASPYLPRAIRAASGSTFRIPLLRGPALKEVKSGLALDAEGDDISTFQWPRDARLILGQEGQGLPPTLHAQKLKIPMSGQVESLNATVAASLALFTYRQSLRK